MDMDIILTQTDIRAIADLMPDTTEGQDYAKRLQAIADGLLHDNVIAHDGFCTVIIHD